MNARKFSDVVCVLMIVMMLVSACAPAAAPGSSDSGLAFAPAAPAAPAEAASGSASRGSGEIQSGTLTAGDFDDNLNFAAFQRYLNSMLQADSAQTLPTTPLADRVSLHIVDAQGRGVANARVSVSTGDGAASLLDATAGADGVFRFFPNFDGANESAQFTARIRPADVDGPETVVSFNLADPGESRTIKVRLDGVSAALPGALDVMLVMDATGSMGDEIRYLTTEFRAIVGAIQSQFPGVSTRFGLIVYRDLGDEFVVRKFDFTDSLDTMQNQLAQQSANGGGDYPEAMEQALSAAVESAWRGGNTARVLFLIADAPPHDQNLLAAVEQGRAARRLGVHIYPLAASGVADTAEYLMRVMAATTHGRYLFLTDDSGVGNAHAEPRVPCYVVTRLDQLLIRVITGELSGQRVEAAPDQIIRSVGQQDGGVCASK
jgi:hypothetical protein